LKNKDLGPLAQAAGLIDKRLRAAIAKREREIADWGRRFEAASLPERVTKAELAEMPCSGVTH
jgi:hypothetical protein